MDRRLSNDADIWMCALAWMITTSVDARDVVYRNRAMRRAQLSRWRSSSGGHSRNACVETSI